MSVSAKEDSRGDGGSSPGSSDEPKNESYPTYLDSFIRWMTKVFIFHIDLTLTVAMVTENGRQYRLKYRLYKYVFLDHILEVLRTVISKIRYQHS